MALSKARLLALVLLVTLLMGASALAVEALPLRQEDLVFFFDGQEYALDAPAKPLVDAIKKSGQDLDTLEADSCLFVGKDKEFSSQELLVGTLPKGSKGDDVIETIMVFMGDFVTARGIGIGNTEEEITAVYGEATLKDYDLIIYALDDAMDGPQLVFVMDLDTDTVLSFYYFFNTQG